MITKQVAEKAALQQLISVDPTSIESSTIGQYRHECCVKAV
ncbi:MAG: hypothetical protein R3E08_02005 [Thiotrichaceae bacterium]